MAGRFVLQKFASGMSRSTSLLSARASASARATTPVIPGASGARYTFSCSREAAKTGWSKTGLPDSVGGVKPTGSSGASNKLQLTDWAARVKAWWAPVQSNLYEMDTSLRNLLLLFVLGAVCFVPLPSEYKNRSKVPVLHCSGCCNCMGSRSKS